MLYVVYIVLFYPIYVANTFFISQIIVTPKKPAFSSTDSAISLNLKQMNKASLIFASFINIV